MEDTAELQSRSANTIFSHISILAKVDIRTMVKVSMRYTPKHILVGEVRDAAALELLKLRTSGRWFSPSTRTARKRLCRVLKNLLRRRASATSKSS
ncbi:MAG: CpaF/VirB11 family protein [Desulfovibrio sp.]|nr:CpaF/VirB11 family protein [Desulfovibrio sp.]